MTMKVHPARAILLVAGSSGSAWWLASSAGAEAAIPALDSLVAAAVLLGGAAAAIGLALLTLAALAESLLGWRPRATGALPAPVRRFLVGSVAAALAAGVAVPASADEVYPGWAPAVAVSTSPSPTVATASPAPSPTPVVTVSPDPVELHAESAAGPLPSDQATEAPPAHGTVHVVEQGESLWRIAAEVLGPTATDAAIADAWPLIYQANRDTIGEDPGLILPGQELTIPKEMAA